MHTPEQTEALWKSAQHYLENWQDPENSKIFSEDCACCQEFATESNYYSCAACPIFQHSEGEDCNNTPWGKCCDTQYGDKHKDALEAEYRFLVALALGEKP